MSKFWWTLRLAIVLRWTEYAGIMSLLACYRYAQAECWQDFRLDGYGPVEAVREDRSCA